MAIKPRLAKGTRDFTPADMALRKFIIGTIQETFETFGFEQIETPAVENLETLTGKYGDEGDKLIFKILNSGDYLLHADEALLKEKNSDKVIPQISEKALRYDLTVPFARYVVQHRNEINFPFRRYQIQPVWRADRPQKGRYREFYQCDADVIGSNALLIEAEFIGLLDAAFSKLNIPSTVKINSRKILYGFCEANGIEKQFVDFTTILDKLDKKPWEALVNDFKEVGFGDDVIENARAMAEISGKDFIVGNIDDLKDLVKGSETGLKGIEELKEVAQILEVSKPTYIQVKLDLTLARGLNYYTGAIIEVVANDVEIGSICGGGRYDDLTGIFGMPDVSGIGISFGIDRIFDILLSKNWEDSTKVKTVMIVNFDQEGLTYNLELLQKLRSSGIHSEIYPDFDKLKKQFKYADQKRIRFVLIAGEEERKKNEFSVKDLENGIQENISEDKIVDYLLNS